MQRGEASPTFYSAKNLAKQEEERLKEKTKKALEAAYAARPQVFIIDEMVNTTEPKNDNDKNNANPEEFNFLALGCHGTGNERQDLAAQLLEKLLENLAKDPNRKPLFILLLGDHYRSGMSSPNDTLFDDLFYKMYLKYPHLKDIVFVHILGNHDENLQKVPDLRYPQGIAQGMNQVAHFWNLADEETKAALESGKLNFKNISKDFPRRFLPSRFYSLLHKGSKTQLFCVDSNTYVEDYLNYLDYKDYAACMNYLDGSSVPPREKSNAKAFIDKLIAQNITDPATQKKLLTEEYIRLGILTAEGKQDTNNQAYWLEKETDIATRAGIKIILAGHHPPYTPSKREYGNDSPIYLNKENIKRFKHYFGELPAGNSYNTQYRTCLSDQKINPYLHLVAHDHFFNNFNNIQDPKADYKTWQVTAGIGGGDEQDREGFSQQKNTGCHMKGLGCVEVKCKDDITVLLHTIEKKSEKKESAEKTISEGKNLKSEATQNELENKTEAVECKFDFLEFKQKSCDPIRHYPHIPEKEITEIKALCAIVKKAIDEYFEFFDEKQTISNGHFLNGIYFKLDSYLPKINKSHGYSGVDRAHHLWAYISAASADNFHTTIKRVYELSLRKETTVKEHSLISYLNKNLNNSEMFKGYTIEKLYQEKYLSEQIASKMSDFIVLDDYYQMQIPK